MMDKLEKNIVNTNGTENAGSDNSNLQGDGNIQAAGNIKVTGNINKNNKFFAVVDRVRYIQRWALMRNNESENVAEHSFQTAIFAHALATIRSVELPELELQVDPNKIMAKALFHDVSEVITGDLPTPVKYHNPELRKAYKDYEALAVDTLLDFLPESLRGNYSELLIEKSLADTERGSLEYLEAGLIKVADKLSAYIKCLYEVNQGNNEFREALKSTLENIEAFYEDFPEVKVFMTDYVPAFSLSLDQLKDSEI